MLQSVHPFQLSARLPNPVDRMRSVVQIMSKEFQRARSKLFQKPIGNAKFSGEVKRPRL